ncbi:MAG TPA: hypothetical protein VMM60_02485 [Ilumatobacter sp.]|nr:hypothetical protein [Ilumatobacter sp.]
MSKRNAIWLGAILAVGVTLWAAFGPMWGIIGAVVVLAASEIVERTRRKNRRAANGGGPTPSVFNVAKRERPQR